MNRPELLAPAGNLEKLKAAVDFGADAVYLGGSRLNLRAFADNFTEEAMREGIKYAHDRNRKVYVTLNVIPHNNDLTGIEDYLISLRDMKVDAIIVSDPSIIVTAREVVPDLEIHLSTQANNVNWKSAEFWHKNGVKRIVLARELSLKEIKDIRSKLSEDCQLEAFVHGSMCMSYSGRCLMSNYMTGRDANRGACAQPCRYKYYLMEEKRPGEYFPVIEDDKGTYIMNSKDLCMIEHIPELINSGIYSFKIEGRMKSAYYVAAVVKSYREAIDSYLENPEAYEFKKQWMDNLNKVSHRQYHTGFYFGEKNKQIYETSSYIREYDIVGVVKSYDKESKRVTVEQRNKIFEGDTLEVLRPAKSNIEVTACDLRDALGEVIESTPQAQMVYSFYSEIELEEKDMLIKGKRGETK